MHYQDPPDEDYDEGAGFEDEGAYWGTTGGWEEPGTHSDYVDPVYYHDPWEQWTYHQQEAFGDEAAELDGGDEGLDITEEEVDLVKQEADATVLAAEASRTLAEARAAVARVRQARGYYQPSKGQAPSKGSGGKSSGKGSGSRCLVCGQTGDWYRDCPQRHGGRGKGSGNSGPSKGFTKSKKGKPSQKGGYRPLVHYLGTYMMETVGVLHTEEAADFGSEETPQFILDTGATECAAGVETIQQLISRAKLKYTMCTDDRPTFRFGDGLTLQATSRVDLKDTSLGDISFYILDGDFRVATHRAEKTPLLVGSKFLRSRCATLVYEDLSLYFKDTSGNLKMTNMAFTRTGHLAVNTTARPVDLGSLRALTEEKFGVTLPGDGARLVQILSSPGALEELRRGQGAAEEIAREGWQPTKVVFPERGRHESGRSRSRSPRGPPRAREHGHEFGVKASRYMDAVASELRESHRLQHVQAFGENPKEEIIDESVRFSLKNPKPEDVITMFGMISGTLALPLSDDSEFEFVRCYHNMFKCFPTASFVCESFALACAMRREIDEIIETPTPPECSAEPEHVMMVSESAVWTVEPVRVPISQQIRSLRLKLLQHRLSRPAPHGFQGSSAGSGHSPGGLAMPGPACDEQRAGQPTRTLGKLRSLWAALALHRDKWQGQASNRRPPATHPQAGDCGAPGGLRGREHDGADHEREDHRDSGPQDASGRAREVQEHHGGPGQRQHHGNDRPDLRREAEPDSEGQGGPDTEAEHQDDGPGQDTCAIGTNELVGSEPLGRGDGDHREQGCGDCPGPGPHPLPGGALGGIEGEGADRGHGGQAHPGRFRGRVAGHTDGRSKCQQWARVKDRDSGARQGFRDDSLVDLSGLPEREGFSTTNRKAIERNGRSFLTTLLCTALTTVAMCQNSEFIEIGCNNLGAAISNEGILHRVVDYKNGFNLDHRDGTAAAISLIKDTGPAFIWVGLPGERLCKVEGDWSPTAWRNFERLRRRDLQRCNEVADGIAHTLAAGGHFAWEWDRRAHFGWKSKAIERSGRRLENMIEICTNAMWMRATMHVVVASRPPRAGKSSRPASSSTTR